MVALIVRLPVFFVVAANALTLQPRGQDPADKFVAETNVNQSRRLLDGLKLQAGPTETYHDIKKNVNHLQQSIFEEQQTALESIRGQKAAYELKLFSQRSDNHAIAKFNAALQRKIHNLTQYVAQMRRQADGLAQSNNDLSNELTTIQKNISTAQEFVKQALEFSMSSLEHSPELDVLAELEQMDESTAREQELKAFAGMRRLSMVGMLEAPGNDPEEIVQRLNATLGDASTRLDENMAKLSAAFDKLFVEGETQRQELLGKQAELNITLASLMQYRERLDQAVVHLQATQENLSKRISALRAFGKNQLGAVTSATHVSLLQRGTKPTLGNDTMSNASQEKQVLMHAHTKQQLITGMHLEAGTTQTYKDLFSGVSNLQDTITGEQQEALQSIRAKKEEYEKQLLKERTTNEKLESANAAIAEKLLALQREVADLRGQADGLKKDNIELTSQLKTIERNMSMASEYVAQALDISKAQLEDAPELEVLAELAAKDKDMAHGEALKTFAGVSLSMLNVVDTGDSPTREPEQILARVEESLNGAASQRIASMAKLGEAFDRILAEVETQRKALEDKQADLNASVESTAVLKERLTRAVEHLDETKKELSSRVGAIRVFGLQHLGADSESMPHDGVAKERNYRAKDDKHAKTYDEQASKQ